MLLIPLTDEAMNLELQAEIEEWQAVAARQEMKLLVFNPELEEIIKWIE